MTNYSIFLIDSAANFGRYVDKTFTAESPIEAVKAAIAEGYICEKGRLIREKDAGIRAQAVGNGVAGYGKDGNALVYRKGNLSIAVNS